LQIAAIYPYRWTGQFSDENALKVAKMEWFEALKEMHEYDIRRGLAHLRAKGGEFPPSIPGFVQMCTPPLSEFGILSREEAYQAFCAKDFSNAVVSKTEIALRPRHFDMTQMWAKDHKREFLTQYDICVRNYIAQNLPSRYAICGDNQSNKKRLTSK
jgi:hypothetical protein